MSQSTNNTLTGAIALLGGAAAVTLVGGGIGVVGTFGAIGIGAFEIFTGGAILSGAAARTAQKKLAKANRVPTKSSTVPTPNTTGLEIESLRRGDF